MFHVGFVLLIEVWASWNSECFLECGSERFGFVGVAPHFTNWGVEAGVTVALLGAVVFCQVLEFAEHVGTGWIVDRVVGIGAEVFEPVGSVFLDHAADLPR